MADRGAARKIFREVAFALGMIAAMGAAFGQDVLPSSDAPSAGLPADAPEDAGSTELPPVETPFQDLSLQGIPDPFDPVDQSGGENSGSPEDSLDAIPALGGSPAAAAGTLTPLDAEADLDRPDASLPPEPAAVGTGLQTFYPGGQAPAFLSNSQAFTLPYTTDQTASVGRARTRIGPFHVGINLSASTAYNDNVFGSSTNRQGDIVSTLTPSLYVRTGTRGNFQLLYTPSFQSYATYTSQNTTNETLLASTTYKFTKLTVGGDFGFSTRNGLFPSANGTANQSTYNLSTYAGYRVGAKTQARLSYDGQLQRSDPGGDSTSNALTVSSNYDLTHRIGIGGGLTAGTSNSDSNQQVFVALNGTGNWHANARFQFGGSFGVEARQLSTNESGGKLLVSPLLNLTASWQPATNTSISLNLYRDVTNNGFDTVQTLISTGVGLSASHLLWKKFSLTATGGLAYSEQVDPFGAQSDNYTYAYTSLSVGYVFRSFLNVSVFVNRQQRFASDTTTGYFTDIFGLSIGTSF